MKVSGHGRPVIFLPGFGCGGSVWNGTVAQLQGFESHVITFAGVAGQPPAPRASLVDIHAQLERYIIENRLVRPIIVGHSLGGTMALWLGATLAGKLGGLVDVDGTAFLPALNDPAITHDKAVAIGKSAPPSSPHRPRLYLLGLPLVSVALALYSLVAAVMT